MAPALQSSPAQASAENSRVDARSPGETHPQAVLPKASVTAPAEELSAVTADERYKHLEELQRQAEKTQRTSQKLEGGSERNLESLDRQIKDCGFWNSVMGTKAALGKQREATEELLKSQRENTKSITNALEQSQKAITEFTAFEEQGRLLESQGKLKEAQLAYNKAQVAYKRAESLLSGHSGLDRNATDKYRASLQSVTDDLNQSINRIDTTETVLRTTRNGLVVVGATVATGGIGAAAASAGFGSLAATGIGFAGATAAGTTISAVSNLAEATGHVAYGNKSQEAAFSEAGSQILKDARSSAIAAASATVGLGVAGKVGGALRSQTAGIGAKAITGMSAGGSGAATSSAINTTQNYVQALTEFNAHYSDLTGADRASAWQSFAEARGLTAGQILRNSALDVTVGALGGSVGGAGSALKQSTGVLRKIGVTALEATADTGVGVTAAVARAKLDGRELTFDDLSAEVISAVQANLIGEMGANASGVFRGPSAPLKAGAAPLAAAATAPQAGRPRGEQRNITYEGKDYSTTYVPGTAKRPAVIYVEQQVIRDFGQRLTGDPNVSLDAFYNNGSDPRVRSFLNQLNPKLAGEAEVMVLPTYKPGDSTAVKLETTGAKAAHEMAHHRNGTNEAKAVEVENSYRQRNGLPKSLEGDVDFSSLRLPDGFAASARPFRKPASHEIQGQKNEIAWVEKFDNRALHADKYIREQGAARQGEERGADLWITRQELQRVCPEALEMFPNGMPIQVKSSPAYAIEHLAIGIDNGRIIPVVVGSPPSNLSPREILRSLANDFMWRPKYAEASDYVSKLDSLVEYIIDKDIPPSITPPRWVENALKGQQNR